MSNRIVAFNDSFTSATAPDVAGQSQENYTIANNAALATIFTLTSTINKTAFADYELIRKDSIGTFAQTGSIIFSYDTQWTMSFGNFHGDEMIVDSIVNSSDVTLSINSSTGVVSYTSGNMVGTSYSGSLKLSIVRIS